MRNQYGQIRWQAWLVGVILVCANCYWLMAGWGRGGYATGQSFPTSLSLYFNAVFSLLLVVIFNAFLARFLKRRVFNPGEMITVYAMTTVASSIGGHDMMQILMPILSYGTWFATPENEWAELFDKYIPRWMAMRMRFIWWPIHPAGYAISGSWSMNPFWFSIFISFLFKWSILRFGGLRAYRKSIPLFLGLVMGEFTVGSFWSILGIAVGRPMYRFLY